MHSEQIAKMACFIKAMELRCICIYQSWCFSIYMQLRANLACYNIQFQLPETLPLETVPDPFSACFYTFTETHQDGL